MGGADGERVRLRVRDDGPGIPAALQSRLFVPFDRLGAEARAGGGHRDRAGRLSRALAELMGGEITFASGPRPGARFIVVLPRPGRAVPPTSASCRRRWLDRAGRNHQRGAGRLLYIEDNEPTSGSMESPGGLRPEWRLIHAGTGSPGLELARAHHPDLVLLDLHLPDLSGVDVLRSAPLRPGHGWHPRGGPQRRRLRQPDPALPRSQGASDYLTKPFDPRGGARPPRPRGPPSGARDGA